MNPMAFPGQAYPGQTRPAPAYVPQQPARQPATWQGAPRVPAGNQTVAQGQNRAPRGGSSIYLPPVKEALSAPKPPPFGRTEAVAQEAAPAPQQALAQTRGAIVRGQAPGDDSPAPALPANMPMKVGMPSREELGLLTAHPSASEPAPDWTAARHQLDRWQATNYRLEKTADSQFRFLCTLPYPQNPGKQRQFEATAASEGEALRLALEQAESWMRTQR